MNEPLSNGGSSGFELADKGVRGWGVGQNAHCLLPSDLEGKYPKRVLSSLSSCSCFMCYRFVKHAQKKYLGKKYPQTILSLLHGMVKRNPFWIVVTVGNERVVVAGTGLSTYL